MAKQTTTVYRSLTLGQKEILRGRFLRTQDPDTAWYCNDCLADLPGDMVAHLDHICEEQPELAPTVHKTRTAEIEIEVGATRINFWGEAQRRRGYVAKAFCTCGWSSGWCDDRRDAQASARHHRTAARPRTQ